VHWRKWILSWKHSRMLMSRRKSTSCSVIKKGYRETTAILRRDSQIWKKVEPFVWLSPRTPSPSSRKNDVLFSRLFCKSREWVCHGGCVMNKRVTDSVF
jgi:hypothetical protein